MKTKAKPAPRKPKPVSAQRSPGKVLPLSPPRPIEPDHPGRVIIREALAAGFSLDAVMPRPASPPEQPPSPSAISMKSQFPQPSLVPETVLLPPDAVTNFDPDPLANSNPVAKSNPVAVQPGWNLLPGSKLPGGERYLKLPHAILDQVLPELNPAEAVLWLRLYRLSYGFGQTTCKVSLPVLAKRTKTSLDTARRALRDLCGKGLIRVLTHTNTGTKEGGTEYEVYEEIGGAFRSEERKKPASDNPKKQPPSKFQPGSKLLPNKHDHDDDDWKRKNHHHDAPVENSANRAKGDGAHDEATIIISSLYESLTGRRWTDKDTRELQKLTHISSGQIEQMVRTIHTRSTEPIGSFAYFSKSILSEVTTSKKNHNRTTLKKKYEKLAREIRSAYVGAQNFKPSDLIAKLKTRCAQEGITWNNDIANEVLGL
jgi:hypothetical protein